VFIGRSHGEEEKGGNSLHGRGVQYSTVKNTPRVIEQPYISGG
jgi:hypothetical protein